MNRFDNDFLNGYMTVTTEADVDIYMRDIINNLNEFNGKELENLRDAINNEIGHEEISNTFGVNNLEDEQKIKILKEFFYKYTWEELEIIKKFLLK